MKPFIKMESEYALVYLIISIVIPPLFIINLIVMLCQVVPRAIKNRKEQKEMEEYNRFLIESEINQSSNMEIREHAERGDNHFLSINSQDKYILYVNLFSVKQSFLGYAEEFEIFLINLSNDTLTKDDLREFVDFLQGLSNLIPKEVLDLLPDYERKDINNCVKVLNKYLDASYIETESHTNWEESIIKNKIEKSLSLAERNQILEEVSKKQKASVIVLTLFGLFFMLFGLIAVVTSTSSIWVMVAMCIIGLFFIVIACVNYNIWDAKSDDEKIADYLGDEDDDKNESKTNFEAPKLISYEDNKIANQLRSLKFLFDEGLITQAEYDAKKKIVLDQITSEFYITPIKHKD